MYTMTFCDDEWVEPETHPLWEFSTYPRSAVHTLMNFDLTSPVPSTTVRTSGTIDLISDQLSSNDGNDGGIHETKYDLVRN